MVEPHQGPYVNKPDFDPPSIHGWAWWDANPKLRERYRGWAQVRDGSWYAFYCNVGPGVPTHPSPTWCVEHESDPNWWYHRDHEMMSQDDRDARGTGPLCRHGAHPGSCPDGSCGSEPGPMPTEEDVVAAGLATLDLLKKMEKQT